MIMYQEILTTIDACAGIAALIMVARMRSMLTALATHLGVRVTADARVVKLDQIEARP